MSNERDELADVYTGHPVGLGPNPKKLMRGHAQEIAAAIITAGYRKVFDGDCGLSKVKDPTEREAAEAWMRWANIVSGNDGNGIAAMQQMLTEFGYRKPRAITTVEELDALPVGSVVLRHGRAFQHYPAYPSPFEEYRKWQCSDGGFVRSTKDGSSILPATVLYEPSE